DVNSFLLPLVSLTSVTIAPGIAAPWLSRTDPAMVPVVSCANADAVQPPGRNSTATSTASILLTAIIVLLRPRLPRLVFVGFLRLLVAFRLNQVLAHEVGETMLTIRFQN